MVIRVLEDLLSRRRADLASYHRLKRELLRTLPVQDAKALSWHLTIPQYHKGEPKKYVEALLPLHDTLMCLHCNDTIKVPLVTHRYHPETFKAYQDCLLKPLAPEVCKCQNLKAFTDRKGSLRVYLEDTDLQSFSYFHGPIDLRVSEVYSDHTSILELLYTPRPQVKDIFHLEVRTHLLVNHINLYKVSEGTIKVLLPYNDLLEYSRAYNIVLYLRNTVVFPTGHQYTYDILRKCRYSIDFTQLKDYRMDVERSKELNRLTNYLYEWTLPETIELQHQKQSKYLAKRLGIPRTYAPSAPYFPFMRHLGCAYTDKTIGYSPTPLCPLGVYSELTILRLPYFPKPHKAHRLHHRQDFRSAPTQVPRHPATTQERILQGSQLEYLKDERIKLLMYLLPRFTHPTSSIIRYITKHLHHLRLPPHTPINYMLTHSGDITGPNAL